jgi:sugar phosphate isomerase/epimerase
MSGKRIMWAGTAGMGRTARQVIDAAAAAAYPAVSLNVPMFFGSTDDELLAVAEYGHAKGVAVAALDGCLSWLPLNSAMAAHTSPFDVTLHVAALLGSPWIGAVAVTDMPVPEMTEPFAQLCRRCADADLDVTIEFTPLSTVPTLGDAVRLLDAAAAPNAGMIFDTWHYYRGAPDPDLLSSLDGRQITAIQVSDAAAEVQGSLMADTLHHRRQPGDGTFDLATVLTTLRDIGAFEHAWYGPEVIADELVAMTPEEAGSYSARRLDECLARLGLTA